MRIGRTDLGLLLALAAGLAAPTGALAGPDTGAAAASGAGGAGSLSGGAGQVISPSLITVKPRIASSSMLMMIWPSLALQSSSVSRNRLVA